MLVDLHNHTPLCRHATGTPFQYVDAALSCGCSYFGFSDHAPMEFDPHYRMSFELMDTYETWVREAQRAYASRITILLGYEVDFLEGGMDERVLTRPCDYLIGSVHFLGKWGFDNPEFIGGYANKAIDAIWEEYFDAIEALAKSGHFDIVGHLDLIKVFKFLPKKDVRLLAKKAIKAIKEANMVVEINGAGLRKPVGEAYPSLALLEEIASLDIPITFGSDAHAPEQVGMGSEEIVSLARNLGYKKCAVFCKREREMIIF